MSWFKSTNFGEFAKTALKEAQKTIDKALDISEADRLREQQEGSSTITADRVAAVTEAASDFFASWGVGAKKSKQPEDDPQNDIPPSPTNSLSKSKPRDTSKIRKQSLQNEDPHSKPPSNPLHLQHKRSTSLETTQPPNSISSSSMMCKSLTSDIPVTLMAPSSQENDAKHNENHHHTRSMSDTIFNSPNDFDLDGAVQVLDEADGHAGFHSFPHSQSFQSYPGMQPLIPTKTEPDSGSKSNILSIPQSVPDSFKDLEQEKSQSQIPNANLIPVLTDEMDYQNVLSLVDLNAPTPLEDMEEHHKGQVDSEMKSQMFKSEDPSDPTCDSSSWSWTENEPESSGLVDVENIDAESEIRTSFLNLSSNQFQDIGGGGGDRTMSTIPVPEVQPGSQDNKLVDTEPPQPLPMLDSGCEADSETVKSSIEQSALSESDDTLTESKEALLSSDTDVTQTDFLESQQYPEIHDMQGDLETLTLAGTSTSSPPPSCPSPLIDSPRSSSPINLKYLNPSEESQSSEGNFELLSHSSLSKFGECGNEGNAKSGGCNTGGGGTEELCLPESSRSSSIVVVSARASSGGSGSCNASTGSDGNQDMDFSQHPEPDSEHSEQRSSSFERIDPPSSHSSDPTSPEFVNKSQHKKGPSSASSSDIEVILSAEFARTPHNTSTCFTETKLISISSKHQQTSIEFQDCFTQTDFPDESRLLAEELPKKLTLEISEMLSEKDQLIDQLREEGEKLSKKQFDLSQITKKLRTKEKEMDNTIKGLKGELAGKNLENDRLMKSFVNKEAAEQGLSENVQRLTNDKRALELRTEQMKSELEDARENCASMKASVEDASVTILELKNAIQSAQRDSSELDTLTREKSELISCNDSLQKELDNLRTTLNSFQSKSSVRESELRSEVTILTRKVHCLENQLSDISSEVADATMPLSLEIEKLQSDLKNSNVVHEKRESFLNSLVQDLDSKYKSAMDRDKSYKELNVSLQTTVSNLEVRLHELESENRDLKREQKVKKENLGKLNVEKETKISKLEDQMRRLTEEVERLNKENEALGTELNKEKAVVDQERKRSQSLVDQFQTQNSVSMGRNLNQNAKGNLANSNGNFVGGGGQKSGENSPSSNSVISEVSYLDEVFDHGHGQRSMTPKSFFDSFSSMGLMEHLQSQLRQRESEVLQFQDEVQKNEKIRKSLNEEIAKLTIRNQEFQMEVESLNELRGRLEEMEKNNNALLQMYGEKVEEADELRMDLQDVKDMYKVQIEQLLKR